MARVKIEKIIEHLSSEMKRALEDAVTRVLPPDVHIDRNQLYREFCRAVGRKCSTWETVPDGSVEID